MATMGAMVPTNTSSGTHQAFWKVGGAIVRQGLLLTASECVFFHSCSSIAAAVVQLAKQPGMFPSHLHAFPASVATVDFVGGLSSQY